MILVGPALPGRDGVRHSLTPAEIPEATFRELANEAADRLSVPWRDAILDCIRRRAVIGTPVPEYVPDRLVNGRLALVGDAAHIVPPTGAKGLNLAVADVALLAPALAALVSRGDRSGADAYSDTALRRVWRCTHFSWWMTTMLHVDDDPFTRQLQLSQLRWVVGSSAGATGLAENYAGLPIDS